MGGYFPRVPAFALGAVWSCLLDLPGVGLAFISPGWIPIC
jgi:hypothetical protein